MTAEWEEPANGSGRGWQLTLWTMVAMQSVMSISFNILSQIMRLLLPDLGVRHRRRPAEGHRRGSLPALVLVKRQSAP